MTKHDKRHGTKGAVFLPGEVNNKTLFDDIDRGWRHFWARRMQKGIFPDDSQDYIAAGRKRKAAA